MIGRQEDKMAWRKVQLKKREKIMIITYISITNS